MPTLAELNAQEAAIQAAKAAHDKAPMDDLIVALETATAPLQTIRDALGVVANPETMGDAEARQRAGELLNVLNLMPGLLATISERITASAAAHIPTEE